jgi:ribonuclease VapC
VSCRPDRAPRNANATITQRKGDIRDRPVPFSFPAPAEQADALVERARITVAPVTEEYVRIARQATLDFDKGNHPAGLNFGDCFSYALSRAAGEPLLFKGEDFTRTDIVSAL